MRDADVTLLEVETIRSLKSMQPAHVPQQGRPLDTNCFNAVRNPEESPITRIEVDSPPGMIKASIAARSEAILTSLTS